MTVGPSGLVGWLGFKDPVYPEGSLPLFRAGDQVPDLVLVDQAPWVDQPFASHSGTVCVGQADFPRADHGGLQLVHHLRTAAVSPAHRVGSIMVALAAASASARKVRGRARTSLRNAVFASSETVAAGPTSKNSACA